MHQAWVGGTSVLVMLLKLVKNIPFVSICMAYFDLTWSLKKINETFESCYVRLVICQMY